MTPLGPLGLRWPPLGNNSFSNQTSSSSNKRQRASDLAESSVPQSSSKRRRAEADDVPSDNEEFFMLRERVCRLEGGLEEVSRQTESLDRSIREKEFRVWNIPFIKNEELVDMFGMVLMEGLGFTQAKVEKFLTESVTLLRRPRLGSNVRQNDTCILVGVNTVAAREMIFSCKSKLNEWRNPWGGKAISITPNYTNKQSAVSKSCRQVMNKLLDKGHRVKMVGYDRLCVDGGYARNFNEFIRDLQDGEQDQR